MDTATDLHVAKDIESRTIAIIGASEVADGVLPFHHIWALEVQLNGLEALALNWEAHGTISGP